MEISTFRPHDLCRDVCNMKQHNLWNIEIIDALHESEFYAHADTGFISMHLARVVRPRMPRTLFLHMPVEVENFSERGGRIQLTAYYPL